jgi:hypothetical protein
MNRNLILIVLLLLTQTGFAQFNHRYLVGSTGMKEIKIIDKNGKVEWSYPCQGKTNDVWQLSSGNVIFSDQNYAKEVTITKETVWEYKAPKGTEIHSISPIGNKYLMALNGTPSKIIELNKKGKVLKTIEYDTGIENAHAQARNIRKTPWGTYLCGTMKTSKILEINKKGEIIREISIPGQAFVGIPLPNKNILIACGEGHCIIEVNQKNEVVWKVQDEDIPTIPLRFVAGLQRLPNGNTVICNWGGHGHRGEQAQIIEITPTKKVVGKVFNYELVNEPSTIHVLDIASKAGKDKLLK